MCFNMLRNSLLASPLVLGMMWTGSAAASMPSATEDTVANVDPAEQVTSVSQLSDVKPTDWAFQALQSLVERYGCIVGYPDKTYRGNRALSRYEFAAGVNACMDRMNELLTAALSDFVRKEDLITIQKLQEEFAAELAVLRGRIDALEVRTATLERQQFSTTTKLVGEVIFNVSDIFGNQVDDLNNTVFQDRVRLGLLTSFTGKDLLTTRLAAGNRESFLLPPNVIGLNRGTAEGLPAFSVGNGTGNSVFVDRLDYTFPIGERLRAFVVAAGGHTGYYTYSTVNPYFEDFDGGNGAISTFAQESPIYRIGGGSGATLNFAIDPDKRFVLSGGYLATNANDPSPGNGLFNGSYSAFGQLTVTPTDWIQVGLTYVHAYHKPGTAIFNLGETNNRFYTGTVAANAFHSGLGVSAITNSYGVQASVKLTPHIVLNGFGGFTDLTLIDTGGGEIWYYGGGLAFPDLFRKGNLGGIFVGREPYLGSVDVGGGLPAALLGVPGSARLGNFGINNSTSLHVEAFYKFQVTNNISVTPGVVWITNPDQEGNNDDFVVGTIRTTFSF
ncbi:iron uptake porin [Kovacikia minuta CCNUW1]|uniref:iron uptake porin n=1 Tax=Kovacikia minuta TaxID=2931930 RepID=UPI001CCCD6D7|nr:iron uptake porin [Kovacikia minuta]UBF26500.1 iron uptake porin [Kovacikia minuta CCNUW1]